MAFSAREIEALLAIKVCIEHRAALLAVMTPDGDLAPVLEGFLRRLEGALRSEGVLVLPPTQQTPPPPLQAQRAS